MKKENENNQKKKRFNLFDHFNKDGKGVEKDEIKAMENPNIVNFFKLYFRKIGRLISVNALYVFGNFPIFFFIFAYAGYTSHHTTIPYYQIFAPLYGASKFGNSSVLSSLMGAFSYQASYTVPTTLTYIIMALSLLVIITFGPVNVGTTYIVRNMVREEPVFVWSDFWYSIKKNLRQGIIFGIIDIALCSMLVYDIIFFGANTNGGFQIGLFYFLSYAMIIFYFFMRLYIYLMMVTFDLSIFKLVKNAAIFAILGIKRNIMALLGIVFCVALVYTLMNVYMPIGIVIPFLLLFSTGSFIGTYCAYPKIKEIMIDPYYSEEKISDDI